MRVYIIVSPKRAHRSRWLLKQETELLTASPSKNKKIE